MRIIYTLSYLVISFSVLGCKQQDVSADTSNEISTETASVTYYSQDAVRKTQLTPIYDVNLTSNMDSSDGSDTRVVSVASLSSSPECEVVGVHHKGFQVSANESMACIYKYGVGSLDTNEAKSNLSYSTALVLSGEQVEVIKPISITTAVNEEVSIYIRDELEQYGDEIGIGFTLDTESLVLPTQEDTGSLFSANPGEDIITYTPGPDFTGVERLIYSYTDGTSVMTGNIDIAVSTEVNSSPKAQYFYFLYDGGNKPIPNGEAITIDVKNYISDSDEDVLQLIDVFAYDATLSIPLDSNSNNNNFDDTVFTFQSNLAGRHSVTYVISDNKGGFATGVIDLMVADVYQNILITSVTPNLLISPPYTSRQAESANIKYVAGPEGEGTLSLSGISNAKHDWVVANGICEARGGELPKASDMQALYESNANGDLFSLHNWPLDSRYWTATVGDETSSFQSIDMSDGTINSNSPSSGYFYVACLSSEAVSVNVLGEDNLSIVGGDGQPIAIYEYQLQGVQANAITSIIDNLLVTWTSQVSPTDLAKFDSSTGELTVFPQSENITGKAIITGCTEQNICGSKSVTIESLLRSVGICGDNINDTDQSNAQENCLKVASDSTGNLYTSTPSISVMESLGYTVDNSATNTGYSYANTYTENGNRGPKGAIFARFRQDGFDVIGPNNEDDSIIGVNSQLDRWCQDLASIEFAGRNDWHRPSLDQLSNLYNELGSLWEGFGWPTEYRYWTKTRYNSSNYYSVRLRNGDTPSTGPTSARYASCVSEQR
ncbi:adhesion domain-containing protein [Vibrio owensii]|uniref:adhesion domain-containing protein n=1 Tax=Vibrio owensii TaxID=696485 RepID=UPI003748515D